MFSISNCYIMMSSGYVCPNLKTATTRNNSAVECCSKNHTENGYIRSVIWCVSDCCGEQDTQYCCDIPRNETPVIIGGVVSCVIILSGLMTLFWCLCWRKGHGVHHHDDHWHLLKEVYAAKTLEELFLPPQSLVSAPGTFLHPVSTVDTTLSTGDCQLLVVPPPHQADAASYYASCHVTPDLPVDDDDEERWERWDGFGSPDNIALSAISGMRSGYSGRDNPHFEGDEGQTRDGDGLQAGGSEEDGDRANLPHYYEFYKKYSQPPPGYEEATTNMSEERMPD